MLRHALVRQDLQRLVVQVFLPRFKRIILGIVWKDFKRCRVRLRLHRSGRPDWNGLGLEAMMAVHRMDSNRLHRERIYRHGLEFIRGCWVIFKNDFVFGTGLFRFHEGWNEGIGLEVCRRVIRKDASRLLGLRAVAGNYFLQLLIREGFRPFIVDLGPH